MNRVNIRWCWETDGETNVQGALIGTQIWEETLMEDTNVQGGFDEDTSVGGHRWWTQVWGVLMRDTSVGVLMRGASVCGGVLMRDINVQGGSNQDISGQGALMRTRVCGGF